MTVTDHAAVRASSPGRRPGTLDQPRQRRRRPQRGTRLAFWSLVSPFFIGLLIFSVIAIIWSIYLSFFNARATLTPTQFVGLNNYIALVTDPAFLSSMGTFALFSIFIVPTTLFFALALALLLHNLPFAQSFFRSVFFLPTAFSYVIGSLIWKLGIFNGSPSGVANSLLASVGLEPVSVWLTQSPYYWVVIVTLRLWMQVGFFMLLFIAGLQRIPQVLYEAASLDGLERGPRRFFLITWPQLRPTITAVVLLLMIGAFQAFDEFYNLVGKIPAARPPLLYIYQVSFAQLDYGKGAAGALVLTIIMVLVAVIQGKFFGFGAAEDTVSRKDRRQEVNR